MKYFILPVLLLLTACECVPVKKEFPPVTDEMMVQAPALKQVSKDAKASEVFDTVVENYGTYHEVSNRLSIWQKWYEEQKKIFNK